MDQLTSDEWSYIMSFIEKNADTCSLLRTCKGISNYKFYFYEEVHFRKIINSKLYDRFINVIISNLDNLPLSIKMLTFDYHFNQPIKDYIPLGVTHLIFGYYFDKPIKDCIPLGVTHLTFGYRFDQPINDYIPSSVEYLEFKGTYQHTVENVVTHNIMINGKNIKKNEK